MKTDELRKAIEDAMETGFRMGYRSGYAIGYESKAADLTYDSTPPSGYFSDDSEPSANPSS